MTALFPLASLYGLALSVPASVAATAAAAPAPTGFGVEIPVLAVGVPALFALAYLLVMLEEFTHMRKSKPVMLAAGLIWVLIALFPPMNAPKHDDEGHGGEATAAHAAVPEPAAPATPEAAAAATAADSRETTTPAKTGAAKTTPAKTGAAKTTEPETTPEEKEHTRRLKMIEAAVRYSLMEYAELFLFLLAAMTYVNAMEERQVFDVLRDKLVGSGMGYRPLFWATGFIAFFLSPVLDNMTTALVTCAALAAVGRDSPKFVALGCINLVDRLQRRRGLQPVRRHHHADGLAKRRAAVPRLLRPVRPEPGQLPRAGGVHALRHSRRAGQPPWKAARICAAGRSA